MNYQSRPLSVISRISPLNPRQDMESDVSSLAATIEACGLIDPLLIWPRTDVIGEYEVLSGGRRWRALRELESRMLDSGQPEYGSDWQIKVEIHQGDEASARRAALAAAVTPRPQHPVDEYEAFSLLSQSGFSAEQIAHDFGETVRRVRQRLALGALSPVVRAMWRAGEIDREAAQAYTAGSIEAQEALVAEWREEDRAHDLDQPQLIRAALRGDAIPAHAPVAKFILRDKARVESYVAAGGRVSEDLFSEQIELRDGPIAKRVATGLLRAEAERVATEEGWRRGVSSDEIGEDFTPLEPELTVEEEEEVNKIDDAVHLTSQGERAGLLARREEIFTAAVLRKIPREERVGYAVVAELQNDGSCYIYRCVELPGENAEEHGSEARAPQPSESGETLEKSLDEVRSATGADGVADASNPLSETGQALRQVIDACATEGLRDVVRTRVDLALMFAVAALGCQYDVAGIALRPVHAREPEDNELLKTIRPLSFRAALGECAAAPTNDLSVALTRIVAAAIATRGASLDAIGALAEAACMRGANVAGAFSNALDRRAFFEAAPKEATLRIIGGIIGPGEAKAVKNYKKDKLAEYVATLSKEKMHLPPPLSNWVAAAPLPRAGDDAMTVGEGQPLALAMRDAIDADENRKVRVETFLELNCTRGNEEIDVGRVKASEVYDAYRNFVTDRHGGKPLSLSVFGEAMKEIGVEKRRGKTGVHYLNIALRDAKE